MTRMTRLATVGPCPIELSQALRASAVELIDGLGGPADLARLSRCGPPERVAYFPSGSSDAAVRLTHGLARRWPTIVVASRDWPHACAVIAAGAHAYLVHEPASDPTFVAAMIVAGARGSPSASARPSPTSPPATRTGRRRAG